MQSEGSLNGGAADDALRWYCIRSKVKQERLAQQSLSQRAGIEAFAPQIRFRRPTRRGMVWFVEGAFPGYLFARFTLAQQLRLVLSTTGVTGLVRFGGSVPALPDSVVAELRASMDAEGVAVVEEPIREGDAVTVTAGPFLGIAGVVKRYMPAVRRVRLLLEFMGRMTDVEVAEDGLTLMERRLGGSLRKAAPS